MNAAPESPGSSLNATKSSCIGKRFEDNKLVIFLMIVVQVAYDDSIINSRIPWARWWVVIFMVCCYAPEMQDCTKAVVRYKTCSDPSRIRQCSTPAHILLDDSLIFLRPTFGFSLFDLQLLLPKAQPLLTTAPASFTCSFDLYYLQLKPSLTPSWDFCPSF